MQKMHERRAQPESVAWGKRADEETREETIADAVCHVLNRVSDAIRLTERLYVQLLRIKGEGWDAQERIKPRGPLPALDAEANYLVDLLYAVSTMVGVLHDAEEP